MQPNGWQILNLTTLARHDLPFLFQRRLTGRTDARPVFDDNVGGSHQMQRLARVAQLPAWLLARLPAQAACPGRLPLQPIRGGRLATIVAILGQPCLQVMHTRQQPGNLLTLLGNFGFTLGDTFIWRHASILLSYYPTILLSYYPTILLSYYPTILHLLRKSV